MCDTAMYIDGLCWLLEPYLTFFFMKMQLISWEINLKIVRYTKWNACKYIWVHDIYY